MSADEDRDDPDAEGRALESAGIARADAERLIATSYDELKGMARKQRRRLGRKPDLLTTDLLHESFLRLRKSNGWEDRAHFMRTAALAMRQIVIDHARRYSSQKRGGDLTPEQARDVAQWFGTVNEDPEQVLIVGDLLEKLWEMSPRAARVVECRYFAGFTEEETADALGVSTRTVRRDWVSARAWILAEGSFADETTLDP